MKLIILQRSAYEFHKCYVRMKTGNVGCVFGFMEPNVCA